MGAYPVFLRVTILAANPFSLILPEDLRHNLGISLASIPGVTEAWAEVSVAVLCLVAVEHLSWVVAVVEAVVEVVEAINAHLNIKNLLPWLRITMSLIKVRMLLKSRILTLLRATKETSSLRLLRPLRTR